MRNEILAVLVVSGVQHVEHVHSVWEAVVRQLVGEVLLELWELLELRVEAPDTELIVERNLDELDLLERKEPLLVGEHQAQHIFVEHAWWRDVQLH